MTFGLADFLREGLVLMCIHDICSLPCLMLSCGLVNVICLIHQGERDLYRTFMLTCYVNEFECEEHIDAIK
jgi:hypothetical protein